MYAAKLPSAAEARYNSTYEDGKNISYIACTLISTMGMVIGGHMTPVYDSLGPKSNERSCGWITSPLRGDTIHPQLRPSGLGPRLSTIIL